MPRSTILILENNEERIRQFQAVLPEFGGFLKMKIWRDAPAMINECGALLPEACLISLDHVSRMPNGTASFPLGGLDVANLLIPLPKICPIILHTGRSERVRSLHQELRAAGWEVERINPLGDDWIPRFWLPKARWLIAKTRTDPPFHGFLTDHTQRMERVSVALTGLSIGDAFGASFETISPLLSARERIANRTPPAPPWPLTDDTFLAACVAERLEQDGRIHPEALARAFSARYRQDPNRGYGRGMKEFLGRISEGISWREAAQSAFSGAGSMGNGAAVRAAPVGAYFAELTDRVIAEAAASAEVTHTHPEGKAGALAVALAAAWAAQHHGQLKITSGADLLAFCTQHMPEGITQTHLQRARTLSFGAPVDYAARILGNGDRGTAPDTVPFALWCAAKHLDDFSEALWTAVSGEGDGDTNCAIVGSIVALAAGVSSVPSEWLQARESPPW